MGTCNNLTLNNGKTKEIIVVDRKRRRHADIATSPEMPKTGGVTSLTVLGVTWTNGLSASEHVRGIINSCAQTLYALRVLRAHRHTGHLQVSHSCQATIRFKRLVGIHVGVRSRTHWWLHESSQAEQFVHPTRVNRKAMWDRRWQTFQ